MVNLRTSHIQVTGYKQKGGGTCKAICQMGMLFIWISCISGTLKAQIGKSFTSTNKLKVT